MLSQRFLRAFGLAGALVGLSLGSNDAAIAQSLSASTGPQQMVPSDSSTVYPSTYPATSPRDVTHAVAVSFHGVVSGYADCIRQ